MQKGSTRAWRGVFGVGIIRGVAGPFLSSCAGLFFPAVASEMGIGIGTLSFAVGISSLAGLLFLPLAGRLIMRWSVRGITLFGIVLAAIPFGLQCFAGTVWIWCAAAVPIGMGTVLLVNLLGPLVINRSFSGNTSFAMGVMTAGAGLVGAVAHPMLVAILTRWGWRIAYAAGGAVALLLTLASELLLPGHKEKENGGGESKPVADKSPLPHGAAMASLFLFMATISAYTAFHQQIATCGTALGLSLSTVGRALSVSMLGSAAGAILIGLLGQIIGSVRVGVAVLVIGAAGLLLFLLFGNIPLLFILASLLHGIASAAIGVTVPALTREFFGKGDEARILARVMTGAPLATLISMPLYGRLFDLTGNYTVPLILILALLISTVIGLLFGAKAAPNNQKNTTAQTRNME